jgi:outer membrane protein OmpA-like peptidoglycan-associated protein
LQAALSPHFDDVRMLLNPTYDQLNGGLQNFLHVLGNADDARLFIYYAGHGYTEVNTSRNEYRGYITGSDTPYADGSPGGYAVARVKAISMEAIRGMVTDVNARQLLFVFDSCFAGTVFAARSPSPAPTRMSQDDIERIMLLPVREFITAGDIQEKIPAHSPIPQLLINALEGDADKYNLGVITGQQIADYLWSHTLGSGITPRNGKLPGGYFDRGEFLFRVGVVRPSLRPRTFVIHFELDKASLTDTARNIIQQAAEEASKVTYQRIEVDGFTDTYSEPRYSLGLSIRMARAVQAELIRSGIPPGAIVIQGFGDTHPVIPTGPHEIKDENRRVEITIR